LQMMQFICAVLMCGAFLYTLTQHRRGLEALMGEQPFHYGWGWSIGSLFIPFWNFYRPWVGFAEVRRAAFGIAKRRRVSLEWKSDGFSTGTLALGLGYLVACFALRVVGKMAGRIMSDPNVDLAAVERLGNLLVVSAGIQVFILFSLVWYLLSIGGALKKVNMSFLTASRFV